MVEKLTVEISGDAKKLLTTLKKASTGVGKFAKDTSKASKTTGKWQKGVRDLGQELGPGLALGAVVSAVGGFTVAAGKAADEARVAERGGQPRFRIATAAPAAGHLH